MKQPPRTILVFVAWLFSLVPCAASAQNYRFVVETMELQVFVQKDASARLEYTITFSNLADPIDIVDIGLPHGDYTIGNMSASIDGAQLGTIRKSEYVDIGVEVPLGSRAIPRGKKGTFRFTCTMPDMVYLDTTDRDKASLQIKPTWFDPQLQMGRTRLSIVVHLPAGIKAEEVVWHRDELRYNELVTVGEGEKKHLAAIWTFADHALSAQNPKIGISFPKRVMDRVVKISAVGLLIKWFSERPSLQLASGIVLFFLTAIWFLRFSGGTGWVVLVILLTVVFFICRISPGWHLMLWPISLGVWSLVEWARTRRASKYMPAMATIEGGGICRGLTAPQAAVLLELPLGKVLTMVIFGLLKKGILQQVSAEPLVVEVDKKFQVANKQRRKAAARLGIVIHDYEQPFVDRLYTWDKPVAQKDFSEAMGKLIKGVAGRMKGFDLSDSRAYYRRIVSRAWKEAEAIGELKRREEAVDRNFEWMVLAPDYGDRFDTWRGRGYHYYPSWTRTASPGAPTPSRPSTPQTSFGEVASSFAGWTENMSGQFAAAIEPAKLGVGSPGLEVLDLGSVDRVTSDFLQALSESGGSSGGGGGGGCACACAGCACACACAGGGR